MQAVAPVGSIAVAESTRKLCEGYFVLKSLGPTRVKGVAEPVNVYEVTGLGPLRTRLQRAVGRGLTKFVGRHREMDALKHALEQARTGHGQIVAAMAEPGVGKSRLFFEFKAVSQSGCMVLEAFSVSHGKASAYLPVIDLLHGYFKITEDDPRTRREKVTGRVGALDRALEDTLPYLFALLGLVEGEDPLAQMDGQIKKRRTLKAITRILLRESLNQPLMVIFEDLHWIDEQTQEFLKLLADSIGTSKIFGDSGKIGVPRGTEWQRLPPALPCFLEALELLKRRESHVADPVLRGQRTLHATTNLRHDSQVETGEQIYAARR